MKTKTNQASTLSFILPPMKRRGFSKRWSSLIEAILRLTFQKHQLGGKMNKQQKKKLKISNADYLPSECPAAFAENY